MFVQKCAKVGVSALCNPAACRGMQGGVLYPRRRWRAMKEQGPPRPCFIYDWLAYASEYSPYLDANSRISRSRVRTKFYRMYSNLLVLGQFFLFVFFFLTLPPFRSLAISFPPSFALFAILSLYSSYWACDHTPWVFALLGLVISLQSNSVSPAA